jgi:hypothetical protein
VQRGRDQLEPSRAGQPALVESWAVAGDHGVLLLSPAQCEPQLSDNHPVSAFGIDCDVAEDRVGAKAECPQLGSKPVYYRR